MQLSSVDIAGAIVGLILGVVALVKVIIPATRWLLGVGSRFMGAVDNIAGRDERIDRATGKPLPAIPAIHERFAGIEQKLDGLAHTDARFERLEARVDVVEATQAALIAGGFERGADAALLAVKKQQEGVIDVEVDE